MISRRQSREAALQGLYQMDSLCDWRAEQIELFLANFWPEALASVDPAARDNLDFTRRLLIGVAAELDVIDADISAASTHWSVARMSRVDRNILRCATFEMFHLLDIPVNVAINEAIEVAKRFGTQDSPTFVNGVLDKLASTARVRREGGVEIGAFCVMPKLAANG